MIRRYLVPAAMLAMLAVAPRPAVADDGLAATATADPKSGLAVRLPPTWVPKKGIQDTGYEAPAKDRVAGGGLAPNVVLSKDAAPGVHPGDVAAIIAGKTKQYAKAFDHFKPLPAGAAAPAIAGKGVGRIDGTFLVAKVLPVRETQVWIVGDDVVYTVTFLSLAETYPTNEPTFEAMIKTLALP